MIFVDEARVFIKAGDGGKGCESFYRDKRMRYPRPDGGDGGKGGDVICQAHRHIRTLLDFKYKQHFKADKGGNASSKGKKGKEGKESILKVPMGTLIRDAESGLLIKDLVEDQQSIVVAKGGQGGLGNASRKIPTQPGVGEQRVINLELKLIADVGLIGFPNAGKSTLISNISKVKSKIAHYPFTTKQPILGIVQGEDFDIIVADLPGIIENAHLGKGLGDRFLRHAERTKILVHVIDMAGGEGRDPLDDFDKINHELNQYNENFSDKSKIVVANKMDLPQAQVNIGRFKERYQERVFETSAQNQQGLDEFVDALRKLICEENSREK